MKKFLLIPIVALFVVAVVSAEQPNSKQKHQPVIQQPKPCGLQVKPYKSNMPAPSKKPVPPFQSTGKLPDKNKNGSSGNNGNTNGNGNANSNKNKNNINVTANATAAPSGVGNGYTYTYNPVDARQFMDARQFSDSRAWAPSFSPSYMPSPQYGLSSPGYGYAPQLPQPIQPVFGQGFTPAPVANGPAENPDTAWVTVEVPHEQAEVFLNDVKMPQKGSIRKYITPPLDPKIIYHYALKVTWPDGKGGKKLYTFNIELKAGDEIVHVVPGAEKKDVPPMPKGGVAPPEKNEEDQGQALENRLKARIQLAKNFVNTEKHQKAKEWLQEIIDKHSDTKAAEAAKELLSKLK